MVTIEESLSYKFYWLNIWYCININGCMKDALTYLCSCCFNFSIVNITFIKDSFGVVMHFCDVKMIYFEKDYLNYEKKWTCTVICQVNINSW